MLLIACVDERKGILFNRRRVSRDAAVCSDILRECEGKRLILSKYSSSLFEGLYRQGKADEQYKAEADAVIGGRAVPETGKSLTGRLIPDIDMVLTERLMPGADASLAERTETGAEAACFLENIEISGCEELIDEIILYRWDRIYPADKYFPFDLSEREWEISGREEWKGSSHERVTKERYQRRKTT